MYVSVDGNPDESIIEGYEYTNKKGNVERVGLSDVVVDLMCAEDCAMSSIYYEDIPKLIKALQAAYTFHMSGKIE